MKKSGGFLSIIKKILIGFGVVLALIIILLVWAGITTSKTYGKFDGVAEPYIREFLRNQSPWNYELAKPQLSFSWLEVTTDEQGDKLFKYFNKLGALKSIDSIEWQRCAKQAHTSTGKIERCDYSVSATFESDVAQIYMGLSLEEDELKIIQLQVNSNAFMQ
ncbi:hypothetical protein R50072_36750 [Simiduia litorea]